jgi:hypothetical protein
MDKQMGLCFGKDNPNLPYWIYTKCEEADDPAIEEPGRGPDGLNTPWSDQHHLYAINRWAHSHLDCRR